VLDSVPLTLHVAFTEPFYSANYKYVSFAGSLSLPYNTLR